MEEKLMVEVVGGWWW